MTKKRLLEKLDKATDVAVSIAINRGFPIKVSNKSTIIGSTFVERNKDGYYDIVTPNGSILFEDIYVFDVAVIIAQRYNSGETAIIKKVLSLEEKFSKHHTDMLHYLNCLKGARKNRDLERMAILEDKFQVSEILAKQARDSILNFKRQK